MQNIQKEDFFKKSLRNHLIEKLQLKSDFYNSNFRSEYKNIKI